ncbi:hypothetical protein FA95DRAFT_107301 [Auriscalpium vulgare]|uniref:Uncharacterized protein n=1 Tax=Auriscalpium vulgare TaxID=40419 RepID=A0ACB8S6F0_9AGAM|nr:hypothetical protein FA95DRAFT_107301 [Auriscalpium vulgare]
MTVTLCLQQPSRPRPNAPAPPRRSLMESHMPPAAFEGYYSNILNSRDVATPRKTPTSLIGVGRRPSAECRRTFTRWRYARAACVVFPTASLFYGRSSTLFVSYGADSDASIDVRVGPITWTVAPKWRDYPAPL